MNIYNKTILIVDSEINICQLLTIRLTFLGYTVFITSNGTEALTSFNKERPDLVILDVLLPKLDGYEVCHKIRKNSIVPIIILTSLSNISDRIRGFESGADDYITKPFSLKELEARIRSLLCRSSSQVLKLKTIRQNILQIKSLMIDANTKKVLKKNSEVKLTNIEYRILNLLIKNPGSKLSRAVILNSIWGYTPEWQADTRIVDVHISRLRSKIEENPSNPELILTERGVGYRFLQY